MTKDEETELYAAYYAEEGEKLRAQSRARSQVLASHSHLRNSKLISTGSQENHLDTVEARKDILRGDASVF
ncbi:hypothetical protein ACFP6B_01980 [Rothia nasimurium]|uniref:hypothetical protein n=1 Tax=Rothia nasimurium TaxID=85336 RepID=UPI003617832D